jgi:hypothetical protein
MFLFLAGRMVAFACSIYEAWSIAQLFMNQARKGKKVAQEVRIPQDKALDDD